MTEDTRSFIATDSRGQWFVLADAPDQDSAQVSGEWIKTLDPVEVRA